MKWRRRVLRGGSTLHLTGEAQVPQLFQQVQRTPVEHADIIRTVTDGGRGAGKRARTKGCITIRLKRTLGEVLLFFFFTTRPLKQFATTGCMHVQRHLLHYESLFT